MKKVLLILSISIIGISMSAQTYERLIDTSKMWVTWIGSTGNQEIGRTEAYRFGDSIFQSGYYWYKLLMAEDENYNNWEIQSYGFLYREADRKVYFLDWNGLAQIMYDFSLSVGDTIPYISNESIYLLGSIDTINFGGKDRKRFNMVNEEGYSRGYYIEGVGNLYGLLYPHQIELIGAYYRFVCFYESDELLYHNPDYETCFLNTMSIAENTKEALNVYPNPTSNQLYVESKLVHSKSVFEIIDIAGKLIEKGCINENNSIDVSVLNKGIYFLKVMTDNKIISINKFIKE
jgi:hypothetical protein